MLKFESMLHRPFGFLNSTSIGVLIAAGVALSTPVHAQDADTAIEQVVVTGSRLVTNGMQAPTPVTALSVSDLADSQPKDLIQSLSQLPSLSGSLSPEQEGINTTPTVSSGAPGGSYLNLRNLNPVRTLVLIDGQRIVPSTGLGSTDISMFPSALVQRVDIVTGGASAAYGSDAVAGVVNFVLNTRFTGFKGDIQGTSSALQDDQGGKLDLTFGDSEFGDRGHLIVSGGYLTNGGVPNDYGRGWALSGVYALPNPAVNSANPASPSNPAAIESVNVQSSSATFGGLIDSGPLKGTQFLSGGVPAPFTYGTLVSSTLMSGGGDGENGGFVTSLVSTQVRENLYGRYTYDVNDNLSVFTELVFGHNHERWGSGPPYETANLFTIFSNNVYLPASIVSQMATNKITSFTMGRIDEDFSPSLYSTVIGDVTSTTQEATIGANWKLGGWSVDGYLAHGYNKFWNRTLYDQNYLRVYQAANAIANPAVGGVPGVAVGMPICQSTLTVPNNGCVPIDLFGAGSPSPAALAYTTGTAWSAQTTQQDDFSIAANGKPFSTWAGPVGIGFGFDYRHQYLIQTVDPDSSTVFPSAATLAAEGILGVPSNLSGAYGTWERSNPQPFGGATNVKEGFIETQVPLLENMPFAEDLEFNGAVRFTDYSFSGDVITWKTGIVYQPIDELHFRGTVSRDIRAPNIYELYTPLSQSGGGATILDPTQGNKSTAGVNMYSSGNLNLKPEKADTYTAGAIYQPAWLSGSSLSLDYYSIKVGGEIGQLGGQQILNQCYAGITFLCPLITRGSNGNVTYIDNDYVNIASVVQNGVDGEFDYQAPLSDIDSDWDGSFSIRSLTNYTGKNLSVQPGTVVNSAGLVGHWQNRTVFTYSNGPLSVNLTERIIGAGIISGTNTPTLTNENHEDGQAYTNIGAAYSIDELGGHYQIYGNINNLFNAPPPIVGGTVVGSTGTTDANKALFDVIGLDFTLGIRFNY